MIRPPVPAVPRGTSVPQPPPDVPHDPATDPDEPADAFALADVTRPAPRLLTYYALCAAATGPLFPVVFLVLYFKYRTLRYAFDAGDDGGVSAAWGILFRKEVHLTYRRVQDLHLTRNVVQRWLGLATVEVQTASAGGEAELKIEGVREYDALRDALYRRMRGARDEPTDRPAAEAAPDEALVLLREIRDALRERAAGEEEGGVGEGDDDAATAAAPFPAAGSGDPR